MGRRVMHRFAGIGVVLVVAAGAVPAAAAESSGGTVPAQVTMADPVEVCLLIDTSGLEEGTLDFGVLEFGADATSAAYSVESCADGDQQLFANGTDASGVDAAWSLVDGAGSRDQDEFSISAELAGLDALWLTTDPSPVGVLGSGEAAIASHQLWTPPAGSSGAGQTLTFDVQWLATSAAAENSPPVITSVTITPAEPTTTDTLTCAATASDADGDVVTVAYTWTVNDQVVGSGPTLSSSFTTKGDTVGCTATPHDGMEAGEPVSAQVIILNSPPVITSVTIAPLEPTTNDDLTCVASGVDDADGDPVSVIYAWTVNGQSAGTGGFLSSTNTTQGDTVVCTATPHDGEEFGEPESSEVVIQ